jgi:hypothetical protein
MISIALTGFSNPITTGCGCVGSGDLADGGAVIAALSEQGEHGGASAGLTLAVTDGLRFSSTPETHTANCAGLNCAARSRSSARYRVQGHPTPGWQSPSGFTPASTNAPA